MANERDEEQFGEKNEFGQDRKAETGQDKQPPAAQQGAFAQQSQQPTGEQGQASTGQAEPGLGGDTATLSNESGGGQSGGTEGAGGFVGSQGSGSDDYLREEGSTGGPDFASQGQGATEGQNAIKGEDATTGLNEDVETGQRNDRDSDIEGGSGNI